MQFNIIAVALEKRGLSRDAVYLLFVNTLSGSLIDRLLRNMKTRPAERGLPREDVRALFGMRKTPVAGEKVFCDYAAS